MRVPRIFSPDQSEIAPFIAANPMAQLVSAGAEFMSATPLPLLLVENPGSPPELLGHFARSNPQVEELAAHPDALAIFMGPHGYASPSWLSDRTQAPTWNYMTVHVHVKVRFDHSPAAAREAVERLTEHMEAGRPNAWSASELGSRYEKLLPGIIAFRAEILKVEAKFKLGQNERADVLRDMLAGLPKEPVHTLQQAMLKANAGRAALEAGQAGAAPERDRS